MNAPETIWASVGYRSEHDIRGEFACHPDIYKGSEQYTRTDTIPDPMSAPRVVALMRAAHIMIEGVDAGYYKNTPAFKDLRAALSAITKEPSHEP